MAPSYYNRSTSQLKQVPSIDKQTLPKKCIQTMMNKRDLARYICIYMHILTKPLKIWTYHLMTVVFALFLLPQSKFIACVDLHCEVLVLKDKHKLEMINV